MNYIFYLIFIISICSEMTYAKSQFTLPPIIEKTKENDVREIDVWNATSDCASIKCYKIYIDKYPDGEFVEIAKEKIRIKIPKPFLDIEKNPISFENSKSFPVEMANENRSINKIYSTLVAIYDPSSNIRKTPRGDIICTVRIVKNINVSKEYIKDSRGTLWFPTNECGQSGYISGSQIRFNMEDFFPKVKDRIKIVKNSKKTKKYHGKWKSELIKIDIKWNSYKKNEGVIGIIETLDGRVVETFTGENYAYRKLKIILGTGVTIKLVAKVKGDIKKWTSPSMNFSRKFK